MKQNFTFGLKFASLVIVRTFNNLSRRLVFAGSLKWLPCDFVITGSNYRNNFFVEKVEFLEKLKIFYVMKHRVIVMMDTILLNISTMWNEERNFGGGQRTLVHNIFISWVRLDCFNIVGDKFKLGLSYISYMCFKCVIACRLKRSLRKSQFDELELEDK